MESYQPNAYLLDSLSKLKNEGSWLNKMLYWEMTTFLVDHNLNYTDKMGMAVGVEIRVPYLDIDLIEYAIKIPPSLKMKGVETKYILKRLAERYLPKEVIYRPKTGFGAPVRKWIVNDMREMIKSRLDPKRLDSIGLFDSDQVWKLINENEQGKIDASYTIWSLLAIDSWMQQFLHQKKLG
jgi:asparagine synthase (glutamine-hydrolysing)